MRENPHLILKQVKENNKGNNDIFKKLAFWNKF